MTKLKTITGLCLFLFAMSLNAQEADSGENFTRKGRLLLGGSTNGGLNFSKTSYEFDGDMVSEDKTNTFVLEGKVGYFIIDNLALGVQTGISRFKNEDEDGNNENTSSSFNAGPFASYYFDVGNSKIRPYVSANTGFGYSKLDGTSAVISSGDSDIVFQSFEQKDRTFMWSAGAGVAFFLNKTIAINVETAYTNRTNKDPDDDFDAKFTTSNLGITGGLSIFF